MPRRKCLQLLSLGASWETAHGHFIDKSQAMADDELEHEGQEVNDFEGFVEKFKNSNLYDCNDTSIRGSNFVIFKTAPRSGKKTRKDVVSSSLRTQNERVHDMLFKVSLFIY